jgi:hypothetical protein
MAKILWGAALVLVLALLLFALGWMCARFAGTSDAKVQETVVAESKAIQERVEARLDRIEGKIDVLLKIATTPPPELKPVK